MEPLELNGDNLGKKHQHYNKLLKEAILNQNFKFTTNFKDDSDINILLQIDVACTNRNVEFVLEAFKCEDMLFVSRAVKRSTWLITDPNYAHIINIDYLQTHLFPYMLTEAINKLMLSIRLHNKDEKRAELFFDYEEKRNVKMALKWLPHCSLPFIELAVAKHKYFLSGNLLNRLCERSISVLEIYITNNRYTNPHKIKGTLFLLKNNAEKYLEIMKKLEYYDIPQFGKKSSKVIMKVCPEKIINNFEKWSHYIDHKICAKYMKKEDIKYFLLKQTKIEAMYSFLQYDCVKPFLQRMPNEGRFKFIKETFIDNEKPYTLKSCTTGRTLPKNVRDWYIFAPFDEAFYDLKKLMRGESPDDRIATLKVLLHCAGNNMDNVYTLLQYYYEKHINEAFKFKIKFIEEVLQNVEVIKHAKIWAIINQLFHSMEVYVVSNNNVQSCIESIIIYSALHGQPNPEIIEEKFIFNTLKKYKKKLRIDEREKVFQYLYNRITDNVNKIPITNEVVFNEVVNMMITILELINDWEKNLNDFPILLSKIKELIAIKLAKSWNANLTPLYNINKSWRKYMFEESIAMWPSEIVCINALKHDPTILSRYEGEIHYLCCNDAASLKVLLNKLRLYWPRSLATEWTNFYLQQLDNPTHHRAVIKALMIILPQDQLTDIIKKHTPEDGKINWGAADELTLSLRKCIAKKMYLSRPLLPVELVLQYAKGDYLQYALPSLSSVLANISSNHSGPIVQQLLSSPVSLQKHGIRLALAKLKSEKLKPLFWQVWKSTNNTTIRAVLFQSTYHALCNKTNTAIVEDLWDLLSDFIDDLSYEENKKIYNLLGEIKKVPINVRGKFYMKSYTFLKSMPSDEHVENIINKLIGVAGDIVQQLDTDFIENVMLKDIDKTFSKSIYPFLNVISRNALFCKDEITQTQRFKRILGPLLDRYLPLWDEKHDDKKYVRFNIEKLLKILASDMADVVLDRSKIIPIKMFTDIQNKLENSLTIKDNYVLITTWKLVTAFNHLLNENRPTLQNVEINETDDMDTRNRYELEHHIIERKSELFNTIIPLFANVCTDNLQVEIKNYFPSIYVLYGQAVHDTLYHFEVYNKNYLLHKHMLTNDQSMENFLLVINHCSIEERDEHKEVQAEIRRLLEAHPSPVVQMHYIEKFNVLETADIY